MSERHTAVIVGGGLIGAAVRRCLSRRGWAVTTLRRTPSPAAVPAVPAVDVATDAGRTELGRIVGSGRPAVCVLVHGPSDVTWCEGNESAATGTHRAAAAAVIGRGVPVVLVSTDNLFAGDRPDYGVDAPTAPPNAYGRAKVLAEQEVLADPLGRVVRVSLVYGPRADPRLRANFAEDCLAAAADPAATFAAPVDQSFTPIFVDDAAAAIAHVAEHPGDAPPLVHAAGTEVLTRFAFAQQAYRAAGADPSFVYAVSKKDTRWASRPHYSCLRETVSELAPGLRPRPVRDGLAETVARLRAGR